jgi:alanine dehydrogenase
MRRGDRHAAPATARATRSISPGRARPVAPKKRRRPRSSGRHSSRASAGSSSPPARPVSWWWESTEPLTSWWSTERTFGLSTPIPNAVVATITSISSSMKRSWIDSRSGPDGSGCAGPCARAGRLSGGAGARYGRPVLVLSRREVEELLDVDALIEALAGAMADLSAGRASVPNRVGALVDEHDGLLAAMPAFTPSARLLATKLVTLFPHNAGSGLPTHQAVIAVFDPENGRPAALLDGTAITAIRTGAGSALATRLLAREDAQTLAILGTGVQARSHARAVTRVRAFRELRVAGRTPAKAQLLAEELSDELDLTIRAAASWAAACDGADVVCATTHAREPVVRREWLARGCHVNSVGYDPHGREVDDATVAESLVIVESRPAALAPVPAGSNDLLEPIERGLIDADHVHAEVGELVLGRRPGRSSTAQLTLYKSVGVAVQDCAAAALALQAARAQGAGREIDV